MRALSAKRNLWKILSLAVIAPEAERLIRRVNVGILYHSVCDGN